MWNYLLGPLLTLLPERWRRKWLADAPVDWPRAAFVSGVAEGVLCLAALVGWYLYYIQVAIDAQASLTAGALLTRDVPQGATGAGMSYAMGLAALTSFVTHPLTWALAYFSIEGALRGLAALLTDEVAATLPLVLVERSIARGQRAVYERRVPRVADVVTRGREEDPWDLKVESCRPKPTWKYPLTISYEGEFFQVAGVAAGGATPARPHVYLLRRPPPGEAYRGVQPYDPEEVLSEEEAPATFWNAVFAPLRAKWRLAKLPPVADIVSRGDGSKGWHLKVESCRPKPMWTHGRTIRYEDVLYSVEGSYESKPPRPFGYALRFLPPNVAARGVLTYSPDEPLQGNSR